MGENKTKITDQNVEEYIQTIDKETRREDIAAIKKMFEEITRKKAVLWNNNMIGFGTYHYKSSRSTQEGDWPITAFSSRKQNITIYIMSGISNYPRILDRLGKHKRSKGSCLYINKLADIDMDVLKELIEKSFKDMIRSEEIN